MMTPDKKPISTSNRICPYLDRIATLSNIFTPEECNQIINTGLNHWEEKDSTLQRDEGEEIEENLVEDFDYRNATLFIPPKPDEWLFNKIFGAITHANNASNGYQFHIQGLAEWPNLIRYQAENIDKHGKPGHYDWHIDIGAGINSATRKISYTLILNPDGYEGGKLCFHTGQNFNEPFPPDQDKIGSMIVFPSYLVHKVTPITSGTRYVIVGWVHGNSFI